MAGLNFTLNIASQTLSNTQLAIQTSSNNISNASTTGYARETAVQVENAGLLTSSGWLGTGASISTISQTRDNFLEQQLMNATTSDSQYTKLASELTSIQSAASDSGTAGVSDALGSFFDSWGTLGQDPTSSSGQNGVYTSAADLASAIKSEYNQLNEISTTEIPGQITDTMDQANTLIDQIAQLNTAIAQTSASTSQPNQLIDERYQAMDSLSKLIPVSFSQNSNGTVTVQTTTSSGQQTIVSGGTGTHIDSTWTITGGQLGGLYTAQTDLKSYISQLNDFASTLITEANSTYGSAGPIFNGTDASSISASSTFLEGQTSSQLSTAAQAISDLQDTSVTFSDGSSSTLQSFLSGIQQNIGNDVDQANTNQTYYDSLKSQIQTQQQAVSGVSMDEEMVNIIQYQQIYQAAAKVVSTCSTLMTTAINMVQ